MSAKAHRWLKWAWAANLPPVVAAYFVLGADLFARLMLFYLAVVSIWANVASHAAGDDAAEAKLAAQANG